MPFGVNLMRSPVLYRAAQSCATYIMIKVLGCCLSTLTDIQEQGRNIVGMVGPELALDLC